MTGRALIFSLKDYMADFWTSLEKTLSFEGGVSDNPNDKGGYTYKGITVKTFRKYYGTDKWRNDLRAITDEQLEHIYRDGYWDRIMGDRIQSQSVAEFLFDFAVNSGAKEAVRNLQLILGTSADGIMGEITLGALNGADARETFEALKMARKRHYRAIAAIRPKNQVFLKGWLKRADSFKFHDDAGNKKP